MLDVAYFHIDGGESNLSAVACMANSVLCSIVHHHANETWYFVLVWEKKKQKTLWSEFF